MPQGRRLAAPRPSREREECRTTSVEPPADFVFERQSGPRLGGVNPWLDRRSGCLWHGFSTRQKSGTSWRKNSRAGHCTKSVATWCVGVGGVAARMQTDQRPPSRSTPRTASSRPHSYRHSRGKEFASCFYARRTSLWCGFGRGGQWKEEDSFPDLIARTAGAGAGSKWGLSGRARPRPPKRLSRGTRIREPSTAGGSSGGPARCLLLCVVVGDAPGLRAGVTFSDGLYYKRTARGGSTSSGPKPQR
jgi:hypothetical protein